MESGRLVFSGCTQGNSAGRGDLAAAEESPKEKASRRLDVKLATRRQAAASEVVRGSRRTGRCFCSSRQIACSREIEG
jgi:hypothetical protein